MPFADLATGIANQACSAANERNWAMPMSLKTNKQHDDEQVSDVQARRGWIEADVSCYRAAVERFGDLVGVLVKQTTPLKVIEQCMRSHGTKID